MVKFIISILLVSYPMSALAEKDAISTSSSADAIKSTVIEDPTKPLFYKEKTKVQVKRAYRPALPTLQSVIVNKNKHSAVINNQYYEVGQVVNGYKISRIDKNTVYLVYRSKSYSVSLYSNTERFTQ